VSFSVKGGTLFGLLGANGAGKTTTIRVLCGLMNTDAGTVSLAGVDVLKNPEEAKKRIGYMSQRFSLYRDLSADENLEFFGGLYGSPDASTAEGRLRIFDSVGLSGFEGELAGNLPGGLPQRLALACALSHRPPVLFLDEPTAGVDPGSRRVFWNLINALADEGTTVVVTTHYLDEAEYCDHIVMMHAGRIVASGGPDELKKRTVPGIVLGISGPGAMTLEARMDRQSWVVETSLFGDTLHVQTGAGLNAAQAREMAALVADDAGCRGLSFEEITPSLEDVFLKIVDSSETTS
jgi:ABC-2 type transport system ATP-binding protein